MYKVHPREKRERKRKERKKVLSKHTFARCVKRSSMSHKNSLIISKGAEVRKQGGDIIWVET
jgi:hypothetical protein